MTGGAEFVRDGVVSTATSPACCPTYHQPIIRGFASRTKITEEITHRFTTILAPWLHATQNETFKRNAKVVPAPVVLPSSCRRWRGPHRPRWRARSRWRQPRTARSRGSWPSRGRWWYRRSRWQRRRVLPDHTIPTAAKNIGERQRASKRRRLFKRRQHADKKTKRSCSTRRPDETTTTAR